MRRLKRQRRRVPNWELRVKFIFSSISLFLASSCEPNFCLSLEDERCLRFEKVQPLDTPAGMENHYNCVSAEKTPTIVFVKQGYFLNEGRAILHGLYERHLQLPDLMSYPSCFYEELGIHTIVIAQGISMFSVLPIHGRSSSILGIVECSSPDIKMTFHHEIFHVMVKKNFAHVEAKDEEKLAENYAKLAIEYLKSGQSVIPVKHLLNNLR